MDTRFYNIENPQYPLYKTYCKRELKNNKNITLLNFISDIFKVRSSNIFFVDSGSSAIMLSISYLKKKIGLERVYVPSYICLELIDAIISSNCRIVLYDIGYTFLPDETFLQKIISEKKTLLILPMFFGKQNIPYPIFSLLSNSDFPIIFDEAQSFPMTPSLTGMINKYWFSSLSFGRSKPCNSIGGGALVCHFAEDDILQYFSYTVEKEHTIKKALVRRKSLCELVEERKIENHTITSINNSQTKKALHNCLAFLQYNNSLKLLDHWFINKIKSFPYIFDKNKKLSEYNFLPIFVDNNKRCSTMKLLGQKGIQTTFYYYPVHKIPKYQKYIENNNESFPDSYNVSSKILILPLNQTYNLNEIYQLLSLVFNIL